MRLASRAICLGVVGLALAAVSAVAADWRVLGEKVVDFRKNPEAVAAKADAGAFAKIRVEVKQANLEIQNVKVVFSDGQSFDATLNTYLGAGSGRVIDLPAAKSIEKIEFTCRPVSSEGRVALVRILGSN